MKQIQPITKSVHGASNCSTHKATPGPVSQQQPKEYQNASQAPGHSNAPSAASGQSSSLKKDAVPAVSSAKATDPKEEVPSSEK